METKNEILERLIREGHLKFEEALILLEKEPVPEITIPYSPCNYPAYPIYPLEPYYGDGFKITCSGTPAERTYTN